LTESRIPRGKLSLLVEWVCRNQVKDMTDEQMMLHNQDSDMLLLDPTNKNSVFRMDLEYGKVVDEWKVSDSVNVDNIIPDTKYAQMNPQQTLIGHCKCLSTTYR
jgi:hypothetical protein